MTLEEYEKLAAATYSEDIVMVLAEDSTLQKRGMRKNPKRPQRMNVFVERKTGKRAGTYLSHGYIGGAGNAVKHPKKVDPEIPEDAFPLMVWVFPGKGPDAKPIVKGFELRERC